MSTFGNLFTELLSIWKEMALSFWAVLPKFFSVFFWVLSAIIVLPCVYVANVIYPEWVKWGEDF